MRIPKLPELLGRIKLTALMKRLFSRLTMQTGGVLKRGEEVHGPSRYLRQLLGRAPQHRPEPRTATPHQATVFRTLAQGRRQQSEKGRHRHSEPQSAGTLAKAPRTSPAQAVRNVYQTIRNILTGRPGETESGPPIQQALSSSIPRSSQHDVSTPSVAIDETTPESSSPQPPMAEIPPVIVPPPTTATPQPRSQLESSPPTSSISSSIANIVQTLAGDKSRDKAPESRPVSSELPKASTPTTAAPSARKELQIATTTATNKPRRSGSEVSKSSWLEKLFSSGPISLVRSSITNISQSLAGGRSNGAAPSEPTTSSEPPAIPPATTATPSARKALQSAASTATEKAQGPGSRGSKSTWLDKLQSAGDIAGVVDPTGIIDGINAVVSLKRAKNEPERRTEHLKNAAISGISIVPLIGDLAKLSKLGRGEKAAAGSVKAAGRATEAPATTAKQSRSFVSQVLTGAQNWAPHALQGAQAVFADRPKTTSQASAQQVGPRGIGPQPSPIGRFLHKMAMPVITGVASLFGSRRETTAAQSQTEFQPSSSSATAPVGSARSQPWWRQPDPAPAPRAESADRGELVWKTILREKWNSYFGKPKKARRRRQAADNQPGNPMSAGAASPPEIPPLGSRGPADSGDDDWWLKKLFPSLLVLGQPGAARARSQGQNVRKAAAMIRLGSFISNHFSNTKPVRTKQGDSHAIGMHEALRQGTNFGDVMGGKKKLEDVEKEIEGNRRLAESKTKFADALKSATGKLGGLALTAVGLTKGLQALNAATLARQRELEYVSPGHAYAGSQADLAKIFRDMESGHRTAGTMKDLTKAQADFQRALLPYKDAFTNLGNRLLTVVTRGMTALLEIANHIPGISHAAKMAARSLEKENNVTMMPWAKFIDDVASKRMSGPSSRRRV